MINNALIKEFRKEYLEYKLENIRESLTIYYKFLFSYIYSSFTFPNDCFVKNQSVLYLKEYVELCNLEKDLLELLKNNIKKTNQMMALEYLDTLSYKKEELFEYYESVFDDVIEAIDLNKPFRAYRSNMNFLTIKEDKNLYDDVLSLSYGLNDVLNYLSIPSYYDELMNHLTITECHEEEDFENIGLVIEDDNYRVVLPEIIDYKTLMININLIYKAYAYSVSITSDIDKTAKDYELKFKFKENKNGRN